MTVIPLFGKVGGGVEKRKKKKKKQKASDPLMKKMKKRGALNQTDRRIVRKLKRKQGEMEEKGETRKRGHSTEGGESLEREAKSKRVSFSSNLEQRKSLDSFNDSLPLETSIATTPTRGILKVKTPVGKREKKDEHATIPVTIEISSTGKMPAKPESTSHAQTRVKLQVKKSVKAQLLAMPKKERREFLRRLREKKRPNSLQAVACKVLWEKLRSRKTSAEEKEKTTNELFDLVKGKAKSLIYAHDTCRVIACLAGLEKRPDIRAALFEELKSEIVPMAKSKYARFFVSKMLRHGSPDERNAIIASLKGHCVSLLRIDASSTIIECAYNDYANAQQRAQLLVEFYGREFARAPMEKKLSLDEIVQLEPGKKAGIVKELEELLKDIVAKKALKHSIVHRLLHEFLTHCDDEQRLEMIDSLKERVVEIVHTPDGARVAQQCVWHGTAKERKIIVKSLKNLAAKTAMDANGYRVLLAIADAVDDTVLVNKCIITDLAKNIATLVENEPGIRVLHYLCHPRNHRYFSKTFCKLLAQGDGNAHSRKASSDRYSQLWTALEKPLITYLAENMRKMITSPATALLVLNALEAPGDADPFPRAIPNEDRLRCYEAIAEIAADEFIPCNHEDGFHIVEQPQSHFVLTRLLACDSRFEVKLSAELARLPAQQLESWVVCNKGCFVLVGMLKAGCAAAEKAVRNAVNEATVKRYSFPGASALLNQLHGGGKHR